MIDIVLLLIIGGSALFGLIKGLVGTVMSTAAWLLAGLAAFQFGRPAGYWLADGGRPTATEVFGGYALSFIGVMLVVIVIGAMARSWVRSVGLSGTDRLLGLGLGLVRGAFMACVLVLVMGFTPLTREPSWRQSSVLPLLAPGAGWMRSKLPQWSMPQLDLRDTPFAGDNGGGLEDLSVAGLEERVSQALDGAKHRAAGGEGETAPAPAAPGPVNIESPGKDPANIESASGRDPANVDAAPRR
jgi:membrane protein required for colicin V production